MPPRKKAKGSEVASRAKGKLQAVSAKDNAEVIDASFDGVGTAGSSNAGPARRHVRGRRGGLKDLPMMPLDVLYEVRLSRPRARRLQLTSFVFTDFQRPPSP